MMTLTTYSWFPTDSINAVIGNASWTSRRGPRDEVSRIRTHLLYVHDHLQQANTGYLSHEQLWRRSKALADLADYADAGVFPCRSPRDGFGRRRPRFIDDRGVHCAVGELVRRSGRPDLAQAINDDFEYALVPDIDCPKLVEWAKSHGFSVHELALIQPMYAPEDPVGLFVFHFILAAIFAGWAGTLVTTVYMLATWPKIGWLRSVVVAAGGWIFCAAAIAAYFQLAPEGASEVAFFGSLLLCQLGYSWAACWVAKQLPRPPFGQEAKMAEAIAQMEQTSGTGGLESGESLSISRFAGASHAGSQKSLRTRDKDE